jgi:hypothetical protein
MNLRQIAGQPRADLDRIHRGEAADIFVLIDDRALDRVGDGHGRRRRSAALLLALAAAHKRHRQRDRRQCQDGETRRIAKLHAFSLIPRPRGRECAASRVELRLQ